MTLFFLDLIFLSLEVIPTIVVDFVHIFQNSIYKKNKNREQEKWFFWRKKITITSIWNIERCIWYSLSLHLFLSRTLNEGAEYLIKPMTKLMQLIYNSKTVPDQWRVAKVIPTHKSGTRDTNLTCQEVEIDHVLYL